MIDTLELEDKLLNYRSPAEKFEDGIDLIKALVYRVIKPKTFIPFNYFYRDNKILIDEATDYLGHSGIKTLGRAGDFSGLLGTPTPLKKIKQIMREYDNMSLDKRVGFVEKNHRYIDTQDSSKYFRSVTGLLKNYKEAFDARVTAEKLTSNPNSKYFGISPDDILALWSKAASDGTALHRYGEALLQDQPAAPPDDPRAVFVPLALEDLWGQGYELAKTEILLYSLELSLAGQSDIILKKKYGPDTYYMIYDWKFLSKPLQKKSYYNMRTKRYKNMSGPFRYLNDCNWIHYSIQLALYQTLSGDPSLVKEKVLIEVTNEGYKFVPAYPMRVFWDENGIQAVYETWNGKYYDSRRDRITENKPTDIIGL